MYHVFSRFYLLRVIKYSLSNASPQQKNSVPQTLCETKRRQNTFIFHYSQQRQPENPIAFRI
jgi:hypothetical protein